MQKIKMLTWNVDTGKVPIGEESAKGNILKDVLIENEIDIAVFVKAYGDGINSVLEDVYTEIPYPEHREGTGVRIFLKEGVFQTLEIYKPKGLHNKLLFVSLRRAGGEEIFNIAAVHLHSKVNNTQRQQLWNNLPIMNKIKELENRLEKISFRKTILVGDFNQNPFEGDLNDIPIINAERNREIIELFFPDNPVYKKKEFDFDFWYNPMWNLLGDDGKNGRRVTGTFFSYTEDETHMWNLIDGFIVRPEFMERIEYNESEIITGTSSTSFLKPGIISKKESLIKEEISDHLPVKFAFLIN